MFVQFRVLLAILTYYLEKSKIEEEKLLSERRYRQKLVYYISKWVGINNVFGVWKDDGVRAFEERLL